MMVRILNSIINNRLFFSFSVNDSSIDHKEEKPNVSNIKQSSNNSADTKQ